jgi:hypothetical protein
MEKAAVRICQIFKIDEMEQFVIEGTKMADTKVDVSELAIADDLHGIRSRIPNCSIDGEEIGVDHPSVGVGEPIIEKFEHKSAQQIIITIYDYKYFFRAAEIMGGVDYI